MTETAYFDTPERAERAQLLVHLINNTRDILYLRAPTGAGKTRFLQHLLPELESDYQPTWYTAGKGDSLADAVPVSRPLATADPELDLLVQDEPQQPGLLVIDDADALGPGEIGQIAEFHRNGEHVLLLGSGAAVQGLDELTLQFVDLPPFSEDQSLEFIRSQGKLGEGALNEKMVLSLHRAAGGKPGPLLLALAGLPPAGNDPSLGNKSPATKKKQLKRPVMDWKWIALAAVLIILLGTMLVFQDRINAWFVPGGEQASESTGANTQRELEATEEPFRSGIVAVAPEDEIATRQDVTAGYAVGQEDPVETQTSSVEPSPVTEQKVGQQDSLAEGEPVDPILDAVIDAAISAAEQAPDVGSAEAQPQESALEQQATDDSVGSSAETAAPEPAAATPLRPVVATVKPPEPKRPTRDSAESGQAWLRAQPANNYTLQLVGSRDRASIDRFMGKHGLSGPHAVFSRDLNGQPWYSLVSGSYPNRDAAIAARDRLPRGLTGVWPRTFASIREQLTGR